MFRSFRCSHHWAQAQVDSKARGYSENKQEVPLTRCNVALSLQQSALHFAPELQILNRLHRFVLIAKQAVDTERIPQASDIPRTPRIPPEQSATPGAADTSKDHPNIPESPQPIAWHVYRFDLIARSHIRERW